MRRANSVGELTATLDPAETSHIARGLRAGIVHKLQVRHKEQVIGDMKHDRASFQLCINSALLSAFGVQVASCRQHVFLQV